MKRVYCSPTNRAFKMNQFHDVTIGNIIMDYCIEEGRWKTLTTYKDNTKEIFECYVKNNDKNSISRYYMVSLDPNCENNSIMGSLGYIYNTQIQGTQPIYRCRIDNDHFISPNSNCEGAIYEALLGYAFPV